MAKCFAHNDGIRVMPDVIQYLNERAADETRWLEALSESEVNTTVVWGLHDNVAPVRVPNHVWQTYLKHKPGRNRYWVVPGADHYVQCDAPHSWPRSFASRSRARTSHCRPSAINPTVRSWWIKARRVW
jgi:pimeloyl-ACP methyl ester carboxylesterase